MFHRILHCRLSTLAVAALGGVCLRCSSSRVEFEERPDAAPEGPLAPTPDGGGDGASDDEEGCPGDIKDIFVLSPSPDTIYRFDPRSLTFTRLGSLDCLTSGASSMAIDRRGVAWVHLGSGTIVNVRLHDLSCREVILNGMPPLTLFGMGFVKNDSAAGESLFLHAGSLFRVDPTTLDVRRAGEGALPGVAELTGTGDGQLWGYTTNNGMITHLEKSSGNSLESYRTPYVGAFTWAFAQWGGDFWIFAGLNPTTASVIRFSPVTGAANIVVEDAGIQIVGAGSSTCAPFRPVP